MVKRKQSFKQDIRQKCLFRAFSDINDSFADWYQATQLEAENLVQELTGTLLPGNL